MCPNATINDLQLALASWSCLVGNKCVACVTITEKVIPTEVVKIHLIAIFLMCTETQQIVPKYVNLSMTDFSIRNLEVLHNGSNFEPNGSQNPES